MTKKHFSEKEKMDMVLSVLRNENSKTELCRKRGLSLKSFDQWQRQFLNSEKAVVHHQSRRERSSLSAIERENNELRRTLEEREHDIFLLKQLLLYR